MINLRNPWKNCLTIRLVAVVDVVFASLLVFIYLQKFLSPIPISHDSVNNDATRLPSIKLFLLGPIIFNSFQVVMAFNLFSAARRRSEPIISYAKANTWFQFSTVMLLFLVLKLFLIMWFPPHGSLSRRDIFGATLIILESIFKIFSLFIVKEFTDDLKCLLSMLPSPQFYCVYAPAPASSSVLFPAAAAPPPPVTSVNTNNSRNGAPVSTYPFVRPVPQIPTVPSAPIAARSNRNSEIITVV